MWHRFLFHRKTFHRDCAGPLFNAKSLGNKLTDPICSLMVLVFMLEKLTPWTTAFLNYHILWRLLKCNLSIRKSFFSGRQIAFTAQRNAFWTLQMVEQGTSLRTALPDCSNFSTTCRNLFSDSSSAKNHCKNIYDMPNKPRQLGCNCSLALV